MHKGDTSTTLSERFGEPIMSLSKEKREFLKSLKCRRVDYVIVGAQSLAFHTRPRYTGAVDILFDPLRENARRLFDF